MLKSLFEGELENYDPKALEVEVPEPDLTKKEKEKTTVSRIKYDRTNRKLAEIKETKSNRSAIAPEKTFLK